MNKYLRSMKWFREMSVLAEDEQRRSRHPEIDSEHLLLALVSIGGPVSDALAGRGVTLASTREAVERTHRERIAKLGISLPEETPRTIPFEPSRGEFRYRKELRTALEKAACQPQPDVSLFRHLLQEPSGRVREVLQDLGVAPESLDLPAAETTAADAKFTYRRFLASPPATVWALLSDPDRWLEWNDLSFTDAEVDPTGVVRARTRSSSQQRSEHRLTIDEPSVSLRWDVVLPERSRQVAQRLRITVSPHRSGTTLTLAMARPQPTGPRGLRYWLLRPIARLIGPALARGVLRGRADNISRAIRA